MYRQNTPLERNYEVRDMSNFKSEKFLDYLNTKLSDLFENNCYSANKLFDNFVQYLPKWWIYLRL